MPLTLTADALQKPSLLYMHFLAAQSISVKLQALVAVLFCAPEVRSMKLSQRVSQAFLAPLPPTFTSESEQQLLVL